MITQGSLRLDLGALPILIAREQDAGSALDTVEPPLVHPGGTEIAGQVSPAKPQKFGELF